MTTLHSMSERKDQPTGRNPKWESSPNAPGVIWHGAIDLAVRLPAGGLVHSSSGALPVGSSQQYDEVDLRLMDTFPASDAVGRY